MRNGFVGLVSAVVLASVITVDGCGGNAGGGKGGSGGAAGTAGGTSGTGGQTCTSVTACSGDIVGTWTAMSSCLTVSGSLDVTPASFSCPSAPITGSLQVTGTFTANADGTYSDDTTTSGNEQFNLASGCLTISSTPVTCDGAATFIKNLGFATLTCTAAAGGGCACAGTVDQHGGIGALSVA